MTNSTALTPAQQIVNLADIMTILLDAEACADRALQMSTNLAAMEALAATATGTLARRVKEAVDVRLGAEMIVAQGITDGQHIAAALALAQRVAREVEMAIVMEKSIALPSATLNVLRRAMASFDAEAR